MQTGPRPPEHKKPYPAGLAIFRPKENSVATADITNRFAFHPAATDDKRNAHEAVRAQAGDVAKVWDVSLPDGREKAVALTKLEEAMFWANAAIARVTRA